MQLFILRSESLMDTVMLIIISFIIIMASNSQAKWSTPIGWFSVVFYSMNHYSPKHKEF